jgi:hypothetical protein
MAIWLQFRFQIEAIRLTSTGKYNRIYL